MLSLIVAWLAARASAGDVVISELMATDDRTLLDEDGEASDWIELFNAGSATVSLAGWHLTDDPDDLRRWTFPAVGLRPGEFLVVFASGKDRAEAGRELHVDFKLSAAGEFLGLVTPSRDLASYFVPAFPPQVPGASFGRAMRVAESAVIPRGAPARYFVPADGTLDGVWTAPSFDDTGWSSASGAVGFDRKAQPGLAALVETDLAGAMLGASSSLYLRVPFDAGGADDGTPASLALRVRYDDGFVAWLNGREVARRGAPGGQPAYHWRALDDREDAAASAIEEILLGFRQDLVRPGRNVLAIQALNRSRFDEDFLMDAALVARSVDSVDILNEEYFAATTPGSPNGSGFSAAAPAPSFSVESGVYPAGLVVELSSGSPDAEIRYTLDGSEPGPDAALYTGPVAISDTLVLAARCFAPGRLPGPVVRHHYLLLDPSLADFSSNLPVVVCSTLAGEVPRNCGGGAYTPVHAKVFDPTASGGRVSLLDAPSFAGPAGLRRRGASSCSFAKPSYNLELRDAAGNDRDAGLLDFPSDSDYALYGPYAIDRSLMRNALAYWMSREIGRWAARTRFVECFVHERGGSLDMRSYLGVYVLMERNKRHPERIDVERLDAGHDDAPLVEGGYILKRDAAGRDEVAISAAGYDNLVFVHPKNPTPAQVDYIRGYLERAIGSLSPEFGSQADSELIDVEAWIDHHILRWFPRSVDAFWVSDYFHKRRDGRLAMGPIWDLDRSMGSGDRRSLLPEGWNDDLAGGASSRYFEEGDFGSWYGRLFENRPPTGDSPWARAYRARWRALRGGPLARERILGQIDAWARELAEAAARDFARWPEAPPRASGFEAEIEHLKNWLERRIAWIDAQFIESPAFVQPPGLVPVGSRVEIAAPEGAVYYTLDGGDPMNAEYLPSPSATVYEEPIVIERDTRVRARARLAERLWSALAEATYTTGSLPLVFSEVMFSPPAWEGDGFGRALYEFVEIHNAGDAPIDLAGVRLVRVTPPATLFDFADGDVRTLLPNAYAVVARSREALSERYGAGGEITVAGIFGGSLHDRRQSIALVGPLEETIVELTYESSWYPPTDGAGYSLVLREGEAGAPGSWSVPARWRPSTAPGGSPGRADPPPPASGRQLPGDTSQDGKLNVVDVVLLLRWLQGTITLGPCDAPAENAALIDVNGDESADLADAVALIMHLFARGQPPALGGSCRSLDGCRDACLEG